MPCSATRSSGRYAVVSVTTAVWPSWLTGGLVSASPCAGPRPPALIRLPCSSGQDPSHRRQRLPRLACRASGSRLAATSCGCCCAAPRRPPISTGSSSNGRPATSPTAAPCAGRWRMSTVSSTSPAAPRCGRPTATSSSRPTSGAPGPCSRRRERAGVERVVFTSSVAAVGPGRARRDRRREPAVPRRAPGDRLRQLQARGRGRGPAGRRPRPAGRDRQPELRPGPRRPDRDLDEPGAQLPAGSGSPPTSTAGSTSSTSATSPMATCWPTESGEVGERYILGGPQLHPRPPLRRPLADLRDRRPAAEASVGYRARRRRAGRPAGPAAAARARRGPLGDAVVDVLERSGQARAGVLAAPPRGDARGLGALAGR